MQRKIFGRSTSLLLPASVHLRWRVVRQAAYRSHLRTRDKPLGFSPDSYPHFTNGFCEMAYQAKSYGRVYHNLYHLVPFYKRAKKDVGKNQGFSQGRKERRPQAQLLDALEDLTGIRERVTVRHENRYERHSWAFYQLRIYIAYKAAWAGVPVRFVDPRNTSKTCSA